MSIEELVLKYGLGSLFVLIGICMGYLSIKFPQKVNRIQDEWKKVPATLTKVNSTETSGGAGSGKSYKFDVEYEYDVDGKTGTRVYPAPVPIGKASFSKSETVTNWVNNHSVGDEVEAFMNPNDESEVYLELYGDDDLSMIRIVFSIFSIVFSVFGLAALVL